MAARIERSIAVVGELLHGQDGIYPSARSICAAMIYDYSCGEDDVDRTAEMLMRRELAQEAARRLQAEDTSGKIQMVVAEFGHEIAGIVHLPGRALVPIYYGDEKWLIATLRKASRRVGAELFDYFHLDRVEASRD